MAAQRLPEVSCLLIVLADEMLDGLQLIGGDTSLPEGTESLLRNAIDRFRSAEAEYQRICRQEGAATDPDGLSRSTVEARDGARHELRSIMDDIVEGLSASLPPHDPRWRLFGLEAPGDKPPDEGGSRGSASCEDAAEAERASGGARSEPQGLGAFRETDLATGKPAEPDAQRRWWKRLVFPWRRMRGAGPAPKEKTGKDITRIKFVF